MREKYSKSVLLVDDDPVDRKLISRALFRRGFDVVLTGEADVAMAAIVSGHIGCVLTDQVMPISGLELARSAQQVRSDINIVFISGGDPKKDLPEDAVFVSKGDREQIIKAVQKCMEKWMISP